VGQACIRVPVAHIVQCGLPIYPSRSRGDAAAANGQTDAALSDTNHQRRDQRGYASVVTAEV